MVVQTRERHLGRFGAIGLHIGELNAQEFFPRDAEVVELELDHLRIACQIPPSFWQGTPEIHDYRLSSWLESKRSSGKLGSQAAPVALIPCGKYAFRLQMVATDETDRPITSAPATDYFVPNIPVAALLDKRKHNLKRQPERRKAAKTQN